MGWDKRGGGRRYYYRCQRDATRRPVRRYVGAGEAAERAAQQDEQRRRERQAAARELAVELDELLKLDALIERFSSLNDLLVAAALAEANYHKHGGEWRRCRGHTNRLDRPENRFEGPGRD
jgi:hypothetical protein